MLYALLLRSLMLMAVLGIKPQALVMLYRYYLLWVRPVTAVKIASLIERRQVDHLLSLPG